MLAISPSMVFAENKSIGPVNSKDTIYQIITDRFVDGDKTNNVLSDKNKHLFDGQGKDLKKFQGGDWKGIINKIDYLKGMGITAVWISAPYENRDDEIKDFKENGGYDSWTSFHGYHVRNYYATNKHFGTLNEFKELRDKLHENNIKLVIDFVTNHTSRGHNPTKNNENEDGKLYEPDKLPNGTYAIDNDGNPYDYNKDGKLENLIADPNNDKDGWFHHFGDRGNDESKWAYRNKELGSLSDFSQENSQVVNYLEKAVNYWTTFGIDGLRHDATLHMSPSFVKGLKDSISSNVTISYFGEFFISRPSSKYDEFVNFPKQTGVNNLDFEMFRSLTSTFGDFSKPMSDFGNMLDYTEKNYEYPNQAVTFIDNHDVTRFGKYQPNEKAFNAGLAALLTSRGIPNIYYGTEQHVKVNEDSDIAGRIFMEKECKFDTNSKQYQLINKISSLRQSNDAIAFGKTTIVKSDENTIIYERKFFDDVVLVAINRQPDKTYTINNIITTLPDDTYHDHLNGLLNGEKLEVKEGKIDSLTLKGGEVGIWTFKKQNNSDAHIGDVVSTMGKAGEKIYIYGQAFDGSVQVKFGDKVAKVISKTSNIIETVVPDDVAPGVNNITIEKNGKTSNSFSYHVLTDDQNQIVFKIKAETRPGEQIYLVGNVAELGNWDVKKCTESLLNPNHPEWYLPVSVPKGKEIEFKFIKKDENGNITWEDKIPNRKVKSSVESAGVIDTPLYVWNK